MTPSKVTVTTDEYIREKLDQLTSSVRRIERASKQSPSLRGANRPPVDTRETSMKIGEFLIIADEQKARQIESELDSSFVGAFCMRSEIADGKHRYSVHRVPTIASSLTDEEIVDQMIKVAMDRASPSD